MLYRKIDTVNAYLENNNIQTVRTIQSEIHDYYAADASNYTSNPLTF